MTSRAQQRVLASDLLRSPRIDLPPTSEPSVPAALEKIASASQRVLSKRIDLLMLDNHEMISRLLVKAALLSVGVFAGLAAWMTAIAAAVAWLMPTWATAGQLGVFSLANAVVAGVVVAFTLRDPPRLSGETDELLEDEAEAAKAASATARTSDRSGLRETASKPEQ